jgi:hypothetical protein
MEVSENDYFGDELSRYFVIVNSLPFMLVIFCPLGVVSFFAGFPVTFFVKLFFVVMKTSVRGRAYDGPNLNVKRLRTSVGKTQFAIGGQHGG